MELDPRLQNISAADLQDFTVPHYPNFDQGYQSALYESGLNDDHGAPAHAHAQAYAQFVTDPHDPSHFNAGTTTTQQAVGNTSVGRNQNGAIHSSTTSPLSTRPSRHIPQHPAQSHYHGNPFSSTTNTIARNKQHQHASGNHPSTTSPQVQRGSSRTKAQLATQRQQPEQQPQLQTQPPPQPQIQAQIQVQPSTPQQQTHPKSNQTPNPHPNPNTNTTPSHDPSQFSHPSTFPLVPTPPNLPEWREKFFNITEPLLLTSEEYHTYFPHVDNIYSHRSTQKYKKKPFVSHYWDCRLKGRPTGTPLSKLRRRQEGKEDEEDTTTAPVSASGAGDAGGDKEVKKRKRKVRERDLCDVKIKVTEFFGRDELEQMGKLGGNEQGDESMMDSGGNTSSRMSSGGQLTFVLEDGNSTGIPSGSAGNRGSAGQADDAMSFGILEPMKKLPEGHPGADGKRWYMIQRVNGTGKDGDDTNLDHKHTLEESDRIKKNSVQRWLLAQEKERKKQHRNKNTTESDGTTTTRSQSVSSAPSFHASGKAQQTAKMHATPVTTQLTLYANSFCPFAQRIWIALEMKGIPYQYVEVTPSHVKDGKCIIPSLLEVCPQGHTPLLRHGKWCIWESDVVLEYLEDLPTGHSLLPLGDPQLRAHCRLWKDHINRKVLPYFYALLLLPTTIGLPADNEPGKPTGAEKQSLLITTLQNYITDLVNASHATGPYFLGGEMTFVDVAFAPWIIRLSRVLEYYREFPKPEVGTRWKTWVDAIESSDAVRRTVSDDKSYHAVYGGVGTDACTVDNLPAPAKGISELRHAQRMIRQEGFGLGGDIWGTLIASENPAGIRGA